MSADTINQTDASEPQAALGKDCELSLRRCWVLAGCHWTLKTSGLLGGAALTPMAPPHCPAATRDRKVDPGSHPGARVSWAAGGPALCPSSWALVPQVIFLCLSLNFYSNLCFRAELIFFSSKCRMCVIPRKASLDL